MSLRSVTSRPHGRRIVTAAAWLLVSCAVAAAATIVAAQPSPTDDDSSFDALYRRGAQINGALKTLTAKFTETTTSSMLTRPLIASGTVAVERPSKVVLHYLLPEPRDVLIDGDRLTVSWPGRGIRDVTNIASANRRIQKYFVDSNPGELRASFDIVSRKADDRPKTYRLTMTPKRKQIREGLSGLDLWLDQTSLLLAAMRMQFPNGDTKLMVLEDVVANPPIDPAVFTIDR
jgi:outer membrane lipoprotein-sorting protein